jgi:PAS domain S-box-containing protein
MSDDQSTHCVLDPTEEQFHMLVESVEEYAIYMLDPTGNIVTWNSGAQKMKQYTAEEIIGKNFACFYTAEDVAAEKPQRNLRRAARKGRIRDQGLRVRKDGSTFYAEVILRAMRDSAGELRGFSKVTRDITEQVRSREIAAEKIAAERASKAKGDFLAALSHELRTPLTPALAAATYLADNADKLQPEFVEDVDIIKRNVQLQARLIDDLLDLTRITHGKLELHFEHVDAHALIPKTIDIAKTDIEKKKLNVSVRLDAEEYHIWADSVRIQQVFWNLINNAVKFTPPGGKIEIRSSNDDYGRFQLQITDNGIGIEIERQASLFRAFEQADPCVSRQFGGLGLGLAIS